MSLKPSVSRQTQESWQPLNMNYPHTFFSGFNFPDLCIFHVFSYTLAKNSCGVSYAANQLIMSLTDSPVCLFHCRLLMCLAWNSYFLRLFAYVHCICDFISLSIASLWYCSLARSVFREMGVSC